ncbi:MAG: hypothetical protein ABJA67_03150 [Chthonomonadales bacterium]
MVYSPYDFNEANRHRVDFVEGKLREGSPVVGISFDGGLLLLTVRKTQRKIFEIYDRILFSALGQQADIEAIRVAAIDVAHREGFERSPDDVTAQRLVGFALSPPLKRVFGDVMSSPAVIRGLFGELGDTPEKDAFFLLNYDGEFQQMNGFAVVAGSAAAEDKMSLWLVGLDEKTTFENAVLLGFKAWAAGSMSSTDASPDEDADAPAEFSEEQVLKHLRESLKSGTAEIGVLDRFTSRESRFRLLGDKEVAGLIKGLK